MKRNIQWKSVIVFGILGLFLAGCAGGTKVVTTQEKYSPSFKAGEFSRYKGKKMVLSSFFNQAQNTKAYAYFSPDKKLTYEVNIQLETFYYNSFQKAFRHVGVNLVDYSYDDRHPYRHHHYWWGVPGPGAYRAPKGVSEFQFTLLSMTDQEFRFKVTLFKEGESKFDKEYTVTMAAATSENPAELEKRAYQLVDLAFTTVLRDREFSRAF